MQKQLHDLCLINMWLSGTMPPALQPALKKQRTLRVLTADQKRWFIELRENSRKFTRSRFTQEFQDNLGGDLFSRSTVSDCLKRDAEKMP